MRTLVSRISLLSCAFLVCGVLVLVTGHNPWLAATSLLRGAVGTPRGVTETLAITTPLLMTGLSVAVAFRAGFFNIGAEGQFLVGAIAATAAATKGHLPWPLVLIFAAAAGGCWSRIAAWLKVRRNAPEIITTIMLNYIAIQLVVYSLQLPPGEGVAGGWLLKQKGNQPESDVLPVSSQMPSLVANTNLHVGILIAFACAIYTWWFLFKTERGFLCRATGANLRAAKASGVQTDRVLFFATTMSGAFSGLAGGMEIAGATKQLTMSAPGYGYTAVAVALLGATNPIGILPAALLFGALNAGGSAMERNAGVPSVMVSIVVGTLVCATALMSRRAKSN